MLRRKKFNKYAQRLKNRACYDEPEFVTEPQKFSPMETPGQKPTYGAIKRELIKNNKNKRQVNIGNIDILIAKEDPKKFKQSRLKTDKPTPKKESCKLNTDFEQKTNKLTLKNQKN